MGVSDKMFLNLLVIVLPALASTSCPAGTFMFEQDSKCLSLADHCFDQNKLIRADLRGCGQKCERDEEPQIHTNKCINLHCKLYTNSGLNQEQRCVPCPEGMTTSEDGKSCVGRSPWGECKLEAEKTRSVSCEGPFCDQLPSTETEQCGDLMTKKLEDLFLEINLMKSKFEADKNIKDQKIKTLESEQMKLRREVTTMKSDISTLKSEKKNIESKISILETTLRTESQNQKSRITTLESDNTSKEGRLRKIENKPYAFQCAYKFKWTAANSVMTWDKLITNVKYGVTGGFSLSSGVFTAGHSGVWEVNFTTVSENDTHEWITAYLYINGKKLSESKYNSGYYKSSGFVVSLGSRTLLLKLNKGDEVKLMTDKLTGDALWQNTLCFHLAQPF